MRCNVCDSSGTWRDGDGFPSSYCTSCGAFIRTRAIKFVLDYLNVLRPNARVMHFAPEKGLSTYIRAKVGDAPYEAYDLDAKRYRFANAKRKDLIAECELLPSRHYDLILHSHIMEHLPCNFTAVIYHLHRSLKLTGWHVMVLPIMRGRHDEYFGKLTDEEATNRFGQFDHVRWFGRDDLPRTVGMIFPLPTDYDLRKFASSDALTEANIPEVFWSGLTGSTVFTFQSKDIKLRGISDDNPDTGGL